MRTIMNHRYSVALPSELVINVVDEPSDGGACHRYLIDCGELSKGEPSGSVLCDIEFQKGPIREKGVNGVTQEALLEVVLDRLQSFQSGPYKCRENAIAITKLEEVLHWLHHRTRDRIVRGVEGTSVI